VPAGSGIRSRPYRHDWPTRRARQKQWQPGRTLTATKLSRKPLCVYRNQANRYHMVNNAINQCSTSRLVTHAPACGGGLVSGSGGSRTMSQAFMLGSIDVVTSHDPCQRDTRGKITGIASMTPLTTCLVGLRQSLGYYWSNMARPNPWRCMQGKAGCYPGPRQIASARPPIGWNTGTPAGCISAAIH
jgi:hypothetical protein